MHPPQKDHSHLWVKLATIRHFPVAVGAFALASFCVPKADMSIKAAAQKAITLVAEHNLPNPLVMSHVCPHAVAVPINIPNFNLVVHAATEEQVSVLWKQLDGRNPFAVTNPLVNTPLGNVSSVFSITWFKI